VLLKDDVLDLNCRTWSRSTEVEDELSVRKIYTLNALHLILELFVSCHSMCILEEEYIIVVLLSELDGDSAVICSRVEYELEVILLVCGCHDTCVVEYHLTLPTLGTDALRDHDCVLVAVNCISRIVDLAPVIVREPE